MVQDNIDIPIIGLFLFFTLAIGFYYGRGIKTFQGYAVGSRKISNTAITISLLATIYEGGTVYHSLDYYYNEGLYVYIRQLLGPLTCLILYRFILIRMSEFLAHFSIAESMGSIYGLAVRMITGVLGMITAIISLVIQIVVGLELTSILLPEIMQFSAHIIAIVALFWVCYTMIGGAKAVVLTDVYQFLLFVLCFPLLIFIFLYYAKDPYIQWQKLRSMPQYQIDSIFNPKTLRTILYNTILCSGRFFDPACFQRFYMASSLSKATKCLYTSVVIRIILSTLFLAVLITLRVGGHTIQPNQNVMKYIIELSYFPGFRAMLITTIYALIMSTADSCLHVASVLFANDIWPIGMALVTKHSTKPSLKVARMASVIIGIISFWIAALHTTPIPLFILINREIYSLCGFIFTIPLLMACFGFRPRAAVVLCTMGINMVIAIAYCIQFKGQCIPKHYIYITFSTNSIILFITYYLFPKQTNTGWVGIKDKSVWELENQLTKRWWQAKLQQFKSPFTKSYWQNIFPKEESTFALLGIYIIINTIIALYFIKRSYVFPYIYSYIAIMAIGTVIMLYPAMHSYQKGTPLLYWVWPIMLFMLLFITPLEWVKLGHYQPMVCALWVCNLCLAIVLLSLEVSMIMLGVALLLHQAIPPYIPHHLTLFLSGFNVFSTELFLAAMLITASIVGWGLYKYVRDISTAKLRVMELTRAYEHRISLEAIYNQANWARLDAVHNGKLLKEMSNRLQETLREPTDQRKIEKEVELFVKKIDKISNLLLWNAKEERSIKLNPNSLQFIAIESAISKANQYILALRKPLALLLRKQTKVSEILVDPELFECLLMLNLWEVSKSKQNRDPIVILTITDTMLQYEHATATPSQSPLTLPALAFGFSTDTITQTTNPFYSVSQTVVPTILPIQKEQFYQLESRQMVEAHGGYTEIIENEKMLTCLYIFPVDGKQVMHLKNYDPADLAANKLAETTESKRQEQALTKLLTQETTLTEKTIVKTIDFIKKAHGLITRKSGAPYYTHPMAVAEILLEVTQDPITITAGLLHDVIEDTPITLHQIEVLYGEEITAVVANVTAYNTNGYPWKLDNNTKKNRLKQCNDIRVVQVKLADRLHNLRTLYARKPINQQRIAQETLAFYIPWGIQNKGPKQWLTEMEKICATVLHSPKA